MTSQSSKMREERERLHVYVGFIRMDSRNKPAWEVIADGRMRSQHASEEEANKAAIVYAFEAGWLARGKQGGSLVLWEERQKAYSKVLDMLRDMKGKNTAQAITELVELANTDPIVPAAPTETGKR